MNTANLLIRCISVVLLGFFCSSGIAAPLDGVSNMLKVWATVAPEEPLDGATVSVRDDKGRLVGRGRTNENGRENILLTTVDPSAFPLKIITTGGSYSGPLSQDSNAVSLSRTFDFTRSGTALPRFCF